MNAELLKAYSRLRDHERKCRLCADPGKYRPVNGVTQSYQHLCEERKPLQAAMMAVDLRKVG